MQVDASVTDEGSQGEEGLPDDDVHVSVWPVQVRSPGQDVRVGRDSDWLLVGVGSGNEL